MAESAIIKAILTLQDKSFTTGLERSQRKLARFGQQLTRTGRDLSLSLTLPLVAAGKAALDTGVQFDLAQRKIGALGGTGKIDALEKSARQLGATTIFTATEVSGLQLNLRKLGQSNGEIQAVQESILQFAQAMDADLGESGTFVVQTMNRFGDELSRVGDKAEQAAFVTDLFAKATAESALDSEKLRTALNFSGAELAQFGISLQDSVALLAVLADNGFEASRGGTALRRVISELAKEGLSGNEAISELLNSTGTYSEQLERFGLRGAGSASALANMSEQFKELNLKLRDSKGFLQSFAGLLDESLFAKFKKVQSAAQELALSFTETFEDTLGRSLDSLADFIRRLAKIPDPIKRVIVQVAALLASLGPILVVLGGLSTALSLAAKLFNNLNFQIKETVKNAKNLTKLAAANPALAILGLSVTGLAIAYKDVHDALDKGQTVVENYHKKAKALLITEEQRKALLGRPVGNLTGNVETDVATIVTNLAIEREKLERAMSDPSAKTLSTKNFIAQTKADIKLMEDLLVKMRVDDPAKARLDSSLKRIQAQAEAAAARAKLIADGEITSVAALIAKFRDLQAQRDKMIGSTSDNEVNLVSLELLNKEISDTEKKLKSLDQELGSFEPILNADFISSLEDIPSAEDFSNLSFLNNLPGSTLDVTTLRPQVSDLLSSLNDLPGPRGVSFADIGRDVEPIQPIIEPEFLESLQQGVSSLELMRRNLADLSNVALGFGQIFGDSVQSAIRGTQSFADALRTNLIDALGQVMRKVIALIIAYTILAIVSGGTTLGPMAGQFAGMNFGQFMGNGLGMGNIPGLGRSTEQGGLRVQGILSGNDLAISTRRGVTANSRIYG